MGTIMGTPFFIAPSDVFARLGRADAPLIFDVRRPEIVAASDTMMPIARFRAPSEAVAEGRAEQSGRAVLVACAHGHNRSQQVVARLRSVGVDASAIAGGYDGWQAAGLPLVKRTARGVSLGAAPTVWVTRRRPKIDRVACPWLINRFLDAQAAFLFVEPDQVLAVAEEVGGVAYDLPGAAFEHDGELCTFDTLLAAFALDADPLLRDLASIVRGADTARLDLAPQCAGLLAVALGLSAQHGDDDHAVLRHGFPVYDALHAWLQHAREERHNWPRAATAAPRV